MEENTEQYFLNVEDNSATVQWKMIKTHCLYDKQVKWKLKLSVFNQNTLIDFDQILYLILLSDTSDQLTQQLEIWN